ncbi:MAG TPA: glycosyltransferase [Acidimicrobiales bacterium]|jgi:glycosyltransferase involved in cell wall biosynthesis|nr:glycosyltransferase [Acidimicrobiales bacterium]
MGSRWVVDVVMPARDEQATVAANVVAARGCRSIREVIVVDDGSADATAELAAAAGAKVVTRGGAGGSKALAMAAGVAASDASAILFVDADCTGLTAAHLEDICAPFLEGRASMSIGHFDYGPFWNAVVARCPPLSGERIVARWIFEAIPAAKLDGYTIEVRLNEVVCEARLATSVGVMPGVHHRTKRVKAGRRAGLGQTWRMYRAILSLLRPLGDIRWRTYWFYLRGLTIER